VTHYADCWEVMIVLKRDQMLTQTLFYQHPYAKIWKSTTLHETTKPKTGGPVHWYCAQPSRAPDEIDGASWDQTWLEAASACPKKMPDTGKAPSNSTTTHVTRHCDQRVFVVVNPCAFLIIHILSTDCTLPGAIFCMVRPTRLAWFARNKDSISSV